MKVTKLNESYSCIDGDYNTLQNIFEYLKVERPGAWFEPSVKAGFTSPYKYFAGIYEKKLIIMNGHLQLLKNFSINPEVLQSNYTKAELTNFIQDIRPTLPHTPWDFQLKAFFESILNVKQINKMCTSSGKSLTISLIAEFFRLQNKKGLLLVPNINLLTQFHNDIRDYNLLPLYNDTHIIGGGSNHKHFENSLTISTWQSLQNWHDELNRIDYVITDEAHRFASEETSAIVKNTINCKYKLGFTGTLPEDPTMKMELIGLFGLPKTYITSSELIERGLATPIVIKSIIFNYSQMDKKLFKECGAYPKKLKFIKDHIQRQEFLINLLEKLKSKGNNLVLFQHTLHGKSIFVDIMKRLFPDVEVKNKDITGKKSFEFQKQYGVYFLNGEDDAKTRELTRKILENHEDAILVANFALLSTGVNIRKLHNLILASPLKSHTTIAQSLGRGMRIHKTKKVFTVYDLVDSTNIRTIGGIFFKQYQHRKNTSYNPEEFPIQEVNFNLFK